MESQVTGLEGGEQASEEGGEQGGGTTLALPGPGTWNGTVKLSQNKEITLGEVTVSNGGLNFSIEDNVLTETLITTQMSPFLISAGTQRERTTSLTTSSAAPVR